MQVKDRKSELALWETLDSGKPIQEAEADMVWPEPVRPCVQNKSVVLAKLHHGACCCADFSHALTHSMLWPMCLSWLAVDLGWLVQMKGPPELCWLTFLPSVSSSIQLPYARNWCMDHAMLHLRQRCSQSTNTHKVHFLIIPSGSLHDLPSQPLLVLGQ